MAFTCSSCRKPTQGEPKISMTGRRLCGRCNDQLLGLAAGAMAGGGQPGQAIATAGWFTRLRDRRRGTRG